ncbi:reverse transcriptase domain-containing protein, partial [Tanacetum coccineum]
MEEISHVLWAHRIMIKSSNGDTPFSLTYGTEAVIPTEIGMPTQKTAEVDMNSKVRSTSFKPGDLVYHSNDASSAEEVGKLRPKWEGPYEEIVSLLGLVQDLIHQQLIGIKSFKISQKTKKQIALVRSVVEVEYRCMASATCEIDVHLVREKVSSDVIKTMKVSSQDHISNVFTKGLAISQHKKLCENLLLVDMFR